MAFELLEDAPKEKKNTNRKGAPQNLIQNQNISEEEKKALLSKGGKVTAEKRKRQKSLRLIAQALLATDVLETDEIFEELTERGLETSYADAMMLSILNKSLHGDVEAARFVRDTAGQKPTDQVQVGNLDGVPFMRKEMQSLSDEELLEMLHSIDD